MDWREVLASVFAAFAIIALLGGFFVSLYFTLTYVFGEEPSFGQLLAVGFFILFVILLNNLFSGGCENERGREEP